LWFLEFSSAKYLRNLIPALYSVSMKWREGRSPHWGIMQADNKASGKSASGAAAAPGRDRGAMDRRLAQASTPDECCVELAKIFGVRPNEVALLRLENGLLKFLCPFELSTAGSIPISSSSAVAAHTAVTKKIELFNNFTRVKHASIFESIKPGGERGDGADGELRPATIHKLMSAPVLDQADKVLGVIQVCHKGFDLASAGPDFTLDDLQQLEVAAKALSNCAFMRASS
jgi:GAF domain-containing protein